jgi:hypothetical protein
MSKTTLLYVVMIVAFVGGLWSIIRIGQSLRAPHDLSGTWTVMQVDRAAQDIAFTVNQSGRFIKLKTDGGSTIHLTQAGTGGGGRELLFRGENQEMTVSLPASEAAGPGPQAQYRFRLTGAVNADYRATRDPQPAAGKSKQS